MNLSPRWVSNLTDCGFEAVHWSSVGPANASDRTIIAYAAEHGFVVLTHDLDFGAILAVTDSDGPSVVQIRADDIAPDAIAPMVVAGLRQMAAELGDGALLTIDAAGTRLRLLPLRRP